MGVTPPYTLHHARYSLSSTTLPALSLFPPILLHVPNDNLVGRETRVMARERTTPNATQKRTCAISLEAKTRTYSAVKSEFENQPYYQAMIVAQGHLAQEPRPILVDNNDMFFVFYWALRRKTISGVVRADTNFQWGSTTPRRNLGRGGSVTPRYGSGSKPKRDGWLKHQFFLQHLVSQEEEAPIASNLLKVTKL